MYDLGTGVELLSFGDFLDTAGPTAPVLDALTAMEVE